MNEYCQQKMVKLKESNSIKNKASPTHFCEELTSGIHQLPCQSILPSKCTSHKSNEGISLILRIVRKNLTTILKVNRKPLKVADNMYMQKRTIKAFGRTPHLHRK